MYRIIRRVFVYLVLIFVWQIVFFWFSFAQSTWNNLECGDNPDICNKSALQFQYYEEFVEDMLAGVQTIQADGKNLWTYDYLGWLFTNKILNIPSENRNILEKLVAEIEESINKKISSATTTIFLLSSLGISSYKDLIWLSILFKSKAFIRDWKTLLNLETQINEVFYELWLSAMADRKIVKSSDFQLILDKYVDSNKLFSKAIIYETATYWDLVKMLLKMNGSMKTFLSLNSINQFDDYKKWKTDWFEITFDMEEMKKLDEAYQCARWFAKCTSSWKDFIKNLKNVRKNLKKSWSSAKTVIVDANKNFSQALNWMFDSYKKDKSEWEKQLTDREIELLQDVYGINTSKLTKQQWIWFSDLLNVAKWNLWWITQSINLNSNFNDDYFNKNNKEQKSINKKKDEENTTDPNLWNDQLLDSIDELEELLGQKPQYPVEVKKDFKNSLWAVVDSINAKHKDELSVLIAIDSSVYLHLYTQIWYRIRDLIDVVWNKDKNLIKNIGTVCELQCSNKWNAGCYAR